MKFFFAFVAVFVFAIQEISSSPLKLLGIGIGESENPDVKQKTSLDNIALLGDVKHSGVQEAGILGNQAILTKIGQNAIQKGPTNIAVGTSVGHCRKQKGGLNVSVLGNTKYNDIQDGKVNAKILDRADNQHSRGKWLNLQIGNRGRKQTTEDGLTIALFNTATESQHFKGPVIGLFNRAPKQKVDKNILFLK